MRLTRTIVIPQKNVGALRLLQVIVIWSGVSSGSLTESANELNGTDVQKVSEQSEVAGTVTSPAVRIGGVVSVAGCAPASVANASASESPRTASAAKR
jgi:hypothetical protein